MQERGFDKPIWITETNVVPHDDPVNAGTDLCHAGPDAGHPRRAGRLHRAGPGHGPGRGRPEDRGVQDEGRRRGRDQRAGPAARGPLPAPGVRRLPGGGAALLQARQRPPLRPGRPAPGGLRQPGPAGQRAVVGRAPGALRAGARLGRRAGPLRRPQRGLLPGAGGRTAPSRSSCARRRRTPTWRTPGPTSSGGARWCWWRWSPGARCRGPRTSTPPLLPPSGRSPPGSPVSRGRAASRTDPRSGACLFPAGQCDPGHSRPRRTVLGWPR